VVQLTDITNLTNATGTARQLNDNNEKIEKEFAEVLYKDGRHSLTKDLDANSRRIINHAGPKTLTDLVRVVDLTDTLKEAESFQLRLDLAESTGSDLIGYSYDIGGGAPRTVQEKLSDQITLLDVVTDAERVQILANVDPGNIAERIRDALLEMRDGTIFDCSVLPETSTWAIDPFAGLRVKRVQFITGSSIIRRDFVNSGGFRLPSRFTWEMRGTTITGTGKITDLPHVSTRDGAAPLLVQTDNWNGTYTGTAGSSTITVNDATGLLPGCLMALSAQQPSSSVSHVLGANIAASGVTSFPFTGGNLTHASANSLIFMLIGSEIIEVLTDAAGTATVQRRGCMSTTAAAHSSGAPITVLLSQIVLVQSVAGNVVTLDQNLLRTAGGTNNVWKAGTLDTAIIGWGVIDGRFQRGDNSFFVNLGGLLANRLVIDGALRSNNAAHGGINLFGCQRASVRMASMFNCGKEDIGAFAWIFSRSIFCRVEIGYVTFGYIGGIIDDKSSNIMYPAAVEGACTDCEIKIGSASDLKYAAVIEGARRCRVSIGVSDSPRGVICEANPVQNVTPELTVDNVIEVMGKPFSSIDVAERGEVQAVAGNQIIINGQRQWVKRVQVSPGSIINIPATSSVDVNFSVADAKVADAYRIIQAGGLPANVTVMPIKPSAAGTATLRFANCGAGGAAVPTSAVLDLLIEGDWHP